ncbi:alpha/beta hydrolase [Herbidospora sp. NBRC 101105]|uniref:alpha/beta hydrolase n=1 Tax=Herbidospora sp. NBRC 101105 TaxID=3032195 RepID=UPI0024A3EEEE|nr:alpha/beta hydrolase [Herbidospora sp. NBRC 101105]GLX93297.1 hydrolase [Herbidospora sp. NBRC 101105]
MNADIDVDVRPEHPLSWQAIAANSLLRGTMKPISAVLLRTTTSLVVANRIIELGGRLPGLVPATVSIEQESFGACSGEWVRGSGDPDSDLQELDESKVVLYLHGGGYFICSPVTHRPITWRLSAVTRRPVLALDYRQGPQHKLAESLADALDAYRALLDRGFAPDGIVLAGDSAGGHLALAMLLSLRDNGLPLPAAAICLSPWADLSDERKTANRWADPLLPAGRVEWMARRWTEGLDNRDPLVSPVFGDYTGLPPLMIVTSTTEVLREEAHRVAERARADGVPVRYEEWRKMPHVFALMADLLPEARLVFPHMGEFVEAVEAAAKAADGEVAA